MTTFNEKIHMPASQCSGSDYCTYFTFFLIAGVSAFEKLYLYKILFSDRVLQKINN